MTPMKFGVADYGMNVWDGGNFDIEYRLARLREIGYEGIERVYAGSAEDAIDKAARYHRLGMDFATCLGPNPELSIKWTSALGKRYVWTNVSGKEFGVFCRQVNTQAEACERWGIHVALHNHMGTLVETQPQVEEFLRNCPKCRLILDTAHLAAVGGDCLHVVRTYADRLEAIHLKDWIMSDRSGRRDPAAAEWWKRGRFCELGAGNIGLDNAAIMRAIAEVGFDGWVFVEQDTHLQDPFADLAVSRQYLRNAGF